MQPKKLKTRQNLTTEIWAYEIDYGLDQDKTELLWMGGQNTTFYLHI